MYEGEEIVQTSRKGLTMRKSRSFVPIKQHRNATPSPLVFSTSNSSDAQSSNEATSFPSSSSSGAPQQRKTMHFAMGRPARPDPTVPTHADDMSDIVNVLLPSNDPCDKRDNVVLGYRRDLELDIVDKQRRRLERQQARLSAKETRKMNKNAKPALEQKAATEANELHKLNHRLAQRWAMEMAVSHFLDELLSKMDRPYMKNVSEAEDEEIERQYGDEGVGSMESDEYMVECQPDICEG